MNRSIVQFIPDRSGHSCGYCKAQNGNISEGMWGHTLTVQDYQDLIDRGWRRSGLYCYKPTMNVTCCPAYTIKCAALDFHLTKSQKKILKRMRKFLIDGQKSNVENTDPTQSLEARLEDSPAMIGLDKIPKVIHDIEMKDLDTSMINLSESKNVNPENNGSSQSRNLPSTRKTSEPDNSEMSVKSLSSPSLNERSEPGGNEIKRNDESKIFESQSLTSVSGISNAEPFTSEDNINLANQLSKQKKNYSTVEGRDSSKPLMKKARLIRLERMKKKLIAEGNPQCGDTIVNCKKSDSGSKSKTLEDFLDEPLPENRKHNLEIRLVNMNVPNNQMDELFTEEHLLYQKYQMAIHNDSLEKCTSNKFNRFLVQTPLKSKQDPTCPDISYGSFHQQYWLDDKLIAVGVIDILPFCVSSVYFFYDPDYSFLSLGSYSSLREVAFVRSLCSKLSQLKYYYMGFYIHSCPKMRYKGRMCPSFLLCPEIYSWHPIEQCIPKLNENKYSRLNDDPNAICLESDIELRKVLILWKNIPLDYGLLEGLSKKKVKHSEIQHYAKLVGKTCSQRMLLYLSNN